MLKKFLIFFLVIGISFLFVTSAQAALVHKNCTDADPATECGIEQAAQTLIIIANWILGIVGAVALAMFVYGGFIWVTAAGNPNRVAKGRSILAGTVIGIIIVLGAFTLVRFIGNSLGVSGEADFEKYLEPSAGSSTSSCQGRADGTRCSINGENVYICLTGKCTGLPLCEYLSSEANNYGVTFEHICAPQGACASDVITSPRLCPTGEVCCKTF